MWFFTSEEDERVIYLTPKQPTVTVGRSTDPDVQFCFPDDTSISRRHATLAIVGSNIIVTDMGSKFGTFVNLGQGDVKMDVNAQVTLCVGHQVKFGVLSNMWTLKKIDFITCASTLKGENLQQLKLLLDKIGGVFKNEWDRTCSYLTMPAITLTVKVVLALAQASHIVSLEYWQKCCDAVSKHARLPDPKDYTPQVIETTLNKDIVSFLPNTNRKQLFAGKKFVFFSRRQMDMYKPVIEAESATAVLLSEAKMTKSMLHTPETVVIQYTFNNTSQESQQHQNQVNGIVNYLKGKGKRVIAEAEIGLAILYCSVEKYCNPSFNFSSEVLKAATAQPSTTYKPNVLAKDTQESTMPLPHQQQVVINESLTQHLNNTMDTSENSVSSKRKLNEMDDLPEESNQKKLAVQHIGSTVSDNDSQEFFNFIEPDKKEDVNVEKKLNFSKPSKRKTDQMDNDEADLFNFVTDKQETRNDSEGAVGSKIFDSESNGLSSTAKRPKLEQPEYKPVMRGLSVKELLENSKVWKCSNEIIDLTGVKQENITEGLEDKINDLSLGTTIVVINNNLIVNGKDSIKVEETVYQNGGKENNYKKFKKVWPLKMQVTVIPKSSMSVVKPDAAVIGELPDSDSEDQAMLNNQAQPKQNNTQTTLTSWLKT